MLNILIPLAGKNTFLVNNSNAFPKLLSDINGKLLVERSAEYFTSLPYPKKIVVAAPQEQIADYKLDKVLTLLDDSIELCSINSSTQGAACSALLTIEQLDLDQPLIISSFEQVIDVDLSTYIDKFIEKDVDAGVLTFDAIHPKWSYVKIDNDGYVIQAAEKLPISKHAIAGFYYFKKASLFIEAAKNMIRNDVKCNELFYISHTLNEIILKEGKVLALPIDSSLYFHIHDEHSLENYEEKFSSSKTERKNAIYSKTKAYITAFNLCDIKSISELMSNNFQLTDPSVSLKGKSTVIEYISNLFTSHPDLKFTSSNIFVDGMNSIIEFELSLDGQTLIGTDVIQWNDNNKMVLLNAYLYEKA